MATPRTTSFRLTGADGGPLRGDVRTAGSGRPAVFICHGFKGFKDWGFFPKVAERLARAGFTAVSFNFSGSGVGEDGETFDELERFAHDTFTKALCDLQIVVAEFAAAGAYGLLGHSRGGGIAVLHAARHPGAKALVTWAGIGTVHRWPEQDVAEWRRRGRLDVVNARTGQVLPLYLDVVHEVDGLAETELNFERAAAGVQAPWLIIHGAEDETVPVAEARRLHAASGSGRTQLHVLPGAGHTFGIKHPWAGPTPDYERVEAMTVEFFATVL